VARWSSIDEREIKAVAKDLPVKSRRNGGKPRIDVREVSTDTD
jgi:hypothetical protein